MDNGGNNSKHAMIDLTLKDSLVIPSGMACIEVTLKKISNKSVPPCVSIDLWIYGSNSYAAYDDIMHLSFKL